MAVHKSTWRPKPPTIIHLHGSGNFYVPGRRVSVLDVMMWKMYGTPSPYIIEAPKPTLREWTLVKPASQRMKENPGMVIRW
jgi:hypothetical protein